MKKGNARKRNIIAISILAIFLIVLGVNAVISKNIQTTEYTVYSEKLPEQFDGYKILQISDLHNETFGEGNKDIYDIVRASEPDVIIFTGDMADGPKDDLTEFYSLAKTLAENYRVYYVFGNHEQRMPLSNQMDIKNAFMDSRVTILENSSVEISQKDEKITIYGLFYDYSYYRNDNGSRIREKDFTADEMNALLGEKGENFSIVLAHNPIDFPAYAEWGADVTFSGHIHGGMVRLPLVGGLLSPDFTFFPKYDSGVYEMNGSQLVVSRGLGKFRVFNRAEIVLTTLKKSTNS